MINRDVTFFEKSHHFHEESKLDSAVNHESLLIPRDDEEFECDNGVNDAEINHDFPEIPNVSVGD